MVNPDLEWHLLHTPMLKSNPTIGAIKHRLGLTYDKAALLSQTHIEIGQLILKRQRAWGELERKEFLDKIAKALMKLIKHSNRKLVASAHNSEECDIFTAVREYDKDLFGDRNDLWWGNLFDGWAGIKQRKIGLVTEAYNTGKQLRIFFLKKD